METCNCPRCNNGWISVEDRLPERGLKVLMLSSKGEYYICCLSDDGDWWERAGYYGLIDTDASYWMPLMQTPATHIKSEGE